MSDYSSLHSRLRILVAKTFKAERLYASMRNSGAGQTERHNPVLDLSNDARAREWQRCHFIFRQILNDVLAGCSRASLSAEVLKVRDRFRAEAKAAAQEVRSGGKKVVEAAGREEFSQMVKLSLELVRAKARVEASNLIADELDSVLGTAQRKACSDSPGLEEFSRLASDLDAVAPPRESEVPTNVVPFKPRLARAGSRSRS